MLRLDFAYARLSNSIDASPLEIVQLRGAGNVIVQPQEIGHMLSPWLTRDAPKSFMMPNPIAEGEVLVTLLPLGLQHEAGVLVAASQRADFPTETERLLLQVAANQAAIGLEEARLMCEQRRTAEELDQRVTQRTKELTIVNEELRKENIERRQAEEALRRSEAYLADAQRLSHTGSWAINSLSKTAVYWSEENFRIWGFDPQQGPPDIEAILQRIHPEDRDRVRQYAEKAVRDRTDYACEFRILLPGGEVRHIQALGHHVFSATGDPVEVAGTHVNVTERKRAEEERQAHLSALESMVRNLAESERKLEEAQRLTHVGYWERDPATDLITWSDETYRIYGLQPQTRILNLAQLPELLHPEDKQIMVQAVAEALRGGRRYDVEYRVVRPNGEVRIVHSQGDVMRDESGRPRRMFGTVQDITERKQAEKRLMAQHTVTQLLAEAATLHEVTPKILRAVCEYLVWDLGTLWSRDHEAGVLRCVEAWHKASVEAPHFDATSRETTFRLGIGLPGRVWSSREPTYIPDIANDANFPRAPIAAREGLHAAFGFPILLGGDVLGVMEFFSHEIRQPDQDLLVMMAAIGSQIGQFIERKRAEDALHHAQVELAHVARVATLGEMSASIAHEINQPLAAVVNNASACLRWLAANNLEEARQSVSLVVSDGHRAGEIIGRIRALAKKTPSRKDWIDVNETILEVIALARSEVHSNGVSLQTRLGDDMPLILGDRIQLQQVILNLIINAIEAMSGVTENSRELVVRSGKDESQGVLVTVRDSGPGLDAENLDHLFTAFFTTKPQGMGMGLAISRSIIEAHGGRLWAAPNESGGAVFQFTLPADAERVS